MFYGPFYTTKYQNGYTSNYAFYRYSYRQKPPYDTPLPYTFERSDSKTYATPWWGAAYCDSATTSDGINTINSQALDKAYGKFREEVFGVEASAGVNLAERKQSIDMFAKRGSQILHFAKSLRRLDFLEATRALGLEVSRAKTTKQWWRAKVRRNNIEFEVKLKRHMHSFADNYLEFHFGWEPLMKDMYSALEISTSSNFKGLGHKAEGKGTVRSPETSYIPRGGNGTMTSITEYPFSHVRMGATIVIDNPNHFLLNQMGLINPAVIAWELVPFSFVVDWFANVGSVLLSYTDFVGIRIINGYTTFFNKKVVREYYNQFSDFYHPPVITAQTYRKERIYVKRVQTILSPKLTFRALKLPSVVRGLTAASLLTQFLGKK